MIPAQHPREQPEPAGEHHPSRVPARRRRPLTSIEFLTDALQNTLEHLNSPVPIS